MLKLWTLACRIDRHGNGAKPGATEIDLHEFRAIAAHQGDPIPWAYAGLFQAKGGPCGNIAALRHGPRRFAGFEQQARAGTLGLVLENRWQSAVGWGKAGG
jgi:hypothetical protein